MYWSLWCSPFILTMLHCSFDQFNLNLQSFTGLPMTICCNQDEHDKNIKKGSKYSRLETRITIKTNNKILNKQLHNLLLFSLSPLPLGSSFSTNLWPLITSKQSTRSWMSLQLNSEENMFENSCKSLIALIVNFVMPFEWPTTEPFIVAMTVAKEWQECQEWVSKNTLKIQNFMLLWRANQYGRSIGSPWHIDKIFFCRIYIWSSFGLPRAENRSFAGFLSGMLYTGCIKKQNRHLTFYRMYKKMWTN